MMLILLLLGPAHAQTPVLDAKSGQVVVAREVDGHLEATRFGMRRALDESRFEKSSSCLRESSLCRGQLFQTEDGRLHEVRAAFANADMVQMEDGRTLKREKIKAIAKSCDKQGWFHREDARLSELEIRKYQNENAAWPIYNNRPFEKGRLSKVVGCFEDGTYAVLHADNEGPNEILLKRLVREPLAGQVALKDYACGETCERHVGESATPVVPHVHAGEAQR